MNFFLQVLKPIISVHSCNKYTQLLQFQQACKMLHLLTKYLLYTLHNLILIMHQFKNILHLIDF